MDFTLFGEFLAVKYCHFLFILRGFRFSLRISVLCGSSAVGIEPKASGPQTSGPWFILFGSYCGQFPQHNNRNQFSLSVARFLFHAKFIYLNFTARTLFGYKFLTDSPGAVVVLHEKVEHSLSLLLTKHIQIHCSLKGIL